MNTVCLAALVALIQPQWGASYTRHYIGTTPARYAVCVDTWQAAELGGVDPIAAVAIATIETKLRWGRVSPAGAIGPMQILPQYHCPQGQVEGCDTLAAGVDALGDRLARYGTLERAAAHYCGGHSPSPGGRCSTLYAPKVAGLAALLAVTERLRARVYHNETVDNVGLQDGVSRSGQCTILVHIPD